jgi:hypothetical protein
MHANRQPIAESDLFRAGLLNPEPDFGKTLAMAGGTPGLARALFMEACANRPDDARLAAYLSVLGSAVEELRLAGNGGVTEARIDLNATLALIGAEAAKGAEPAILMEIARVLARAGVEPPAALKTALGSAMERVRPESIESALEDMMEGALAEIAAEAGDDPFAIHMELSETLSGLPDEQRAVIVSGLPASRHPGVRAAGLGFVLDRAESCATAALDAAHELEAALDAGALQRLLLMKPWLPESRQKSVERLISGRVVETAAPAATGSGREARKCMSTFTDGAGARSLFVVAKTGRKWTFVALLLKEELGVVDAWAQEGLTKRRADEMAERVADEAGAAPVSRELALLHVAHALAINARTSPPPFGLVQFCELMGVRELAPNAISTAAMIEGLLAETPLSLRDSDATARAHDHVLAWCEASLVAESWFEAGEAVEALLGKISDRTKRPATVLDRLLPPRRAIWAERLAMAAAIMKDADGDDPLWREAALVARDIAGDVPLKDIPLMERIAANTVRAFESYRGIS